MPSDDTIYAYAVGRTRALEKRLLEKSQIERMIEASSAEDVIKVLSESDYANALADLTDIYDFEKVLQSELQKSLELIKGISPKPELIALMALRYDVHNLKVIFKAKYLGIKSDLIVPAGTIAAPRLQSAVDEEDFRDLPDRLRKACEMITEGFPVSRDPQLIDINLDQALFEQLLHDAKRLNNAYMEGLFSRQVDLINLKTLVRVKRMGLDREFLKKALISGGFLAHDRLTVFIDEPLESLITGLSMSQYSELAAEGIRDWIDKGTASRLEKLADDYITGYLKKGKWSPFGVEPLIGYLWAKEIEIKNIRLLMVGKINKLPSEAIRERIRDVYI